MFAAERGVTALGPALTVGVSLGREFRAVEVVGPVLCRLVSVVGGSIALIGGLEDGSTHDHALVQGSLPGIQQGLASIQLGLALCG